MTRTYWTRHPRNFGNEYDIGVATSRAHAEAYLAKGYERLNRPSALYALTDRGDNATQVYVGASVDGVAIDDRFALARSLRA